MQGFSYIANAVTLRLDQQRCIGCGRCSEVCPHDVFAMQGNRARVQDRDACMECGACMTNCAPGAISVEAGVGCAAGLIMQWFAGVFPGLFKQGSSCCGP